MAKKEKKKYYNPEILKRHDFNYIREHFYDHDYTLEDIRGDIYEVYNDNLDLTQLSAEGKNTVRVTNYFVNRTQMKATSIAAKMSPNQAIYNDEALCEIFNRIDTHPRFFSMREAAEYELSKRGLTKEILDVDTSQMPEIQREGVEAMKQEYINTLNKADLREVRRAVAHMPAYHRVSQFPNHVAQRIYERYAPIKGGIILDSSSGWGNRMMAAMSSKYGYKYLGTDPNSEMHPNYRALANTIYEVIYEDKEPGYNRVYPRDYIDIRDQGSEFDIPEWHNNSGYEILSNTVDGGPPILENMFTGNQTELVYDLTALRPSFEAHGIKHPSNNGKGCCDTGELNTTGANLEPIWETHDESIFYSGIGDLSFTSPPYFFLECYTEDSQNGDLSTGQSAGKGSRYTQWITDFVYPTVVNHFNYLKPGGYYIYNLKNLPKDNLFLYSDWMSVCLDVGFELIEEPTMVLKSRRQFGRKDDGSEAIDFNGATELVGVLRKPLKHTDNHITPENKDALYHIQNNFTYPLIKKCRPAQFKSKLPDVVETYLANKYKDMKYKKK